MSGTHRSTHSDAASSEACDVNDSEPDEPRCIVVRMAERMCHLRMRHLALTHV